MEHLGCYLNSENHGEVLVEGGSYCLIGTAVGPREGCGASNVLPPVQLVLLQVVNPVVLLVVLLGVFPSADFHCFHLVQIRHCDNILHLLLQAEPCMSAASSPRIAAAGSDDRKAEPSIQYMGLRVHLASLAARR